MKQISSADNKLTINNQISKLGKKESQNLHVFYGSQNYLNTKQLRVNMHLFLNVTI